jgi:hypothetical protein
VNERSEIVNRPTEELAYVATCEGGTGGPCCDPDCEKCWPDREPPDPDGECFRGREYASALAEQQARIQRELKR